MKKKTTKEFPDAKITPKKQKLTPAYIKEVTASVTRVLNTYKKNGGLIIMSAPTGKKDKNKGEEMEGTFMAHNYSKEQILYILFTTMMNELDVTPDEINRATKATIMMNLKNSLTDLRDGLKGIVDEEKSIKSKAKAKKTK